MQMYVVRAYILYVIGSIFVTNTSLSVTFDFLPLLKNLDEVNDYAWGAAVLANLHNGLRKVNVRLAVDLTGAPDLKISMTLFLMSGWINLYIGKLFKNKKKAAKTVSFNIRAQSLLAEDGIPFPKIFVLFCRLFGGLTSQGASHRHGLAPKQFGIEEAQLVGGLLQIHSRKGRLNPERSWAAVYELVPFVTPWEYRFNNMIEDIGGLVDTVFVFSGLEKCSIPRIWKEGGIYRRMKINLGNCVDRSMGRIVGGKIVHEVALSRASAITILAPLHDRQHNKDALKPSSCLLGKDCYEQEK
ncbi:protein MAINTENANCE OF MERISTEMS-like [Tripterygium wilfordii]|uniref:protein MAINTENANCE OF MERISTEMS-like n=1 Tax=Tripterygium wilfordii TaxID=458696 RepID=UPI0018F813FD|nr:protein MAINTENANCE OF MERISTEMS-like [Tripterygium wilfordii]